MLQLTGTDAAFLYMETANTPMHIAGVYILAPEGGNFDYPRFKQFVADRLQVSRIFRQKLVKAPFDITHPYWVEDAQFNMDNHITRIAVPHPGGDEEFMPLVSKILSRPLDMTKPLWEIYVIEGLENLQNYPKGAYAVITKVHHAAIDGMSGAEIAGAFFDTEPTPRPLKKDTWKGEATPSTWQIAWQGIQASISTTPKTLASFLYNTAKNSIGVATQALQTQKAISTAPLVNVPRTIFNGKVSPQRAFDGVALPLAEIKKVRALVEGATLNDVILTMCSGALRRYLQERNALPEQSLVSFCPKSVRPEDQKSAMGNQISGMFVALATEEADPLVRLQKIHAKTSTSKLYSAALELDKAINLVPSMVESVAMNLYQTLHLSDYHTPFCNVTITNVPGPQLPLFMNGSEMLVNYGAGPITHGMGLIIPIFSYNGKVMISATVCKEMMPDVDKFVGYIAEELQILLALLPQKSQNEETIKAQKPATPKTTKKVAVKKPLNGVAV
jgi:WS/DGAT/MGAT family acyltransferase